MATTGTLDVIGAEETKTFTWNGDVNDRAAARQAFDSAIAKGGTLAVVFEGPGRAKQVRSFDEIEQQEHERGTVTAQVSTGLVGG